MSEWFFLKIYYIFILAAPGLHCSTWASLVAACGILVPQPGMEPGPPALGAWSLNHWTTREVPSECFLYQVGRTVRQDLDLLGHKSPFLQSTHCSLSLGRNLNSQPLT